MRRLCNPQTGAGCSVNSGHMSCKINPWKKGCVKMSNQGFKPSPLTTFTTTQKPVRPNNNPSLVATEQLLRGPKEFQGTFYGHYLKFRMIDC